MLIHISINLSGISEAIILIPGQRGDVTPFGNNDAEAPRRLDTIWGRQVGNCPPPTANLRVSKGNVNRATRDDRTATVSRRVPVCTVWPEDTVC